MKISNQNGRKKHFGIACYKIDGFSIGACFTYDKLLNEVYLYLNIGFFTACIGWIEKQCSNGE